MDIKNCIDIAVREVLNGVDEAKKSLVEVADVGYPTRIELEFNIAANYEVANYDDPAIVAKVRVSIPVFKKGEPTNPGAELLVGKSAEKTAKKAK